MKRYPLPLVLIALVVFVGCSSSTETVQQQSSSDQPIIYGFLQDTVGPGWGAYVYGRHLEYSKVWLGDTLLQSRDSLNTTLISFTVPQWATTDYVYVGQSLQNRVRSPKPLVIRTTQPATTFRITTIDKSTATAGERIAIYGSHLLDKKDSLSVLYANLLLPIDQFTNDSMIVHLPEKTTSSALQIIYQDKVFASFAIAIVRPIIWRHLTMTVVGFDYTATHHRSGYSDFQNRKIDSAWAERTTLNGSWTADLNTGALSPNGSAFMIQGTFPFTGTSGYLQANMSWDTVKQTASFYFYARTYAQQILPVSISNDTGVVFSVVTDRSLNADAADSVMIPLSTLAGQPSISYTHSESDHNGEYSWTETSNYNPSPNYGVGRMIVTLKP